MLLAGGATEASARAARSHTGALASDLASIRAALPGRRDRAGRLARRRSSTSRMGLLSHRRPKGRRIALAADGGGHTVVASDLVIAEGLELPELTDATRAQLAEALPPTATLVNPVDFAGGGEQDIRSFERVIGSLLRSGEVDTVILTGYFGGYSAVLGRVRGEREDVGDRHGAGRRGDRRALPGVTRCTGAPGPPRRCARTACPSTGTWRPQSASRPGSHGERRRRSCTCPSCRSRRRLSKGSRTTTPRAKSSPTPGSPLPLPGASPVQRKPSPSLRRSGTPSC